MIRRAHPGRVRMSAASAGSSLALGALMLACSTPECARTSTQHEAAAVETTVRDLDTLCGKRADQEVHLADGHRLLVWSWSMHFTELDPGTFSYVAVACGDDVVGLEKVWPGARLAATGGGDVVLSAEDYDVLSDASNPVERKLAVLSGMKFAAPLFATAAP